MGSNSPRGRYDFEDIPRLNALLDHGLLLGLDPDDDHTQYLLANGTRPLAGNWSLGNNNLIDVGNLTGTDTDISAGTGDYTSSGTVEAEQLTSTDDITMQGHLLTMGDAGAATDTVLSFLGSTNSGTLTWDEGSNLFNLGASGLIVDTNTLVVDAVNHRIGIKVANPTYNLDILGNMRMRNVTTDATTKEFLFLGSQYDNADGEYVILRGATSGTNKNIVFLGGGKGGFDAATGIRFYTSLVENTNHGTLRMHLHNTGGISMGDTFSGVDPGANVVIIEGKLGLGVSDPDTKLEVFNAGDQLKLSWDATNYATFTSSVNGLNLTISGTTLTINKPIEIFASGSLLATAASAAGDINTIILNSDGTSAASTASLLFQGGAGLNAAKIEAFRNGDFSAAGQATGGLKFYYSAVNSYTLGLEMDGAGDFDFQNGDVDIGGILTVGDGTNETTISATGDIDYVGTGGLPFGGISVIGGAVNTTLNSTGGKVQITTFVTNDTSNGTVVPDAAGDEIGVAAGMYMVTISMTAEN
ncbi:MAG: hypothetical protein KAS32_04165, partial [Candidatus Peribacteraceae bacterium]|nr:hypothetical protein [Candidatus Peribacteraceae bacterium]